jgi:hypothetical protein
VTTSQQKQAHRQSCGCNDASVKVAEWLMFDRLHLSGSTNQCLVLYQGITCLAIKCLQEGSTDTQVRKYLRLAAWACSATWFLLLNI